MSVKLDVNATAVLAVVGVAVAGYVAWRVARAGSELAGEAMDAAGRAAQAVNPLNPDNVAATAVNAGVSAAAGRPETLGGAIRSATSNDDARIEAMLRGDPVPPPKSLFNPSTWFN